MDNPADNPADNLANNPADNPADNPHPTPSLFRNLELAKSLLAENIKQNNCFTISIAIIASQSMVILICIILKSNQPVS